MTISRAAIVVLALLISPAAAAACEIACAAPAHAAHQAPVDVTPAAHHDHHAHHLPVATQAASSEAPASQPFSAPPRIGSDRCDLLTVVPGRPRGSSLDHTAASVAAGPLGLPPVVSAPRIVQAREDAVPHAPPHRSSIPLRL